MTASRFWTLLLALAALASALGVVHTKHQGRVSFNQLQTLLAERDRKEIDWGRLQLEQSTLAQHARIERIAYAQLEMVQPTRPRLVRLGQ